MTSDIVAMCPAFAVALGPGGRSGDMPSGKSRDELPTVQVHALRRMTTAQDAEMWWVKTLYPW